MQIIDEYAARVSIETHDEEFVNVTEDRLAEMVIENVFQQRSSSLEESHIDTPLAPYGYTERDDNYGFVVVDLSPATQHHHNTPIPSPHHSHHSRMSPTDRRVIEEIVHDNAAGEAIEESNTTSVRHMAYNIVRSLTPIQKTIVILFAITAACGVYVVAKVSITN